MDEMEKSPTSEPLKEDQVKLNDELELIVLSKKFLQLFGLFFIGYLVGYLHFSVWWVTIVALVVVVREKRLCRQKRRVEFQREIAMNEKAMVHSTVKNLPNWVYFPDTERAEWLNKILKQMWPFISEYLTNVLRTQIEQNIENNMPDYCKGFRFEKIDFGTIAPRLASVKCYDEQTGRDEIILDLELIYAGNSDVQVKIKGLGAGIKDFQLYGMLRVELKPLIPQSPIVGCLSFYFLKTPIIEYNFTNLGNILDFPVLSDFLRQGIYELIKKMVVLPNKFVMPLVENLQETVKFIHPVGMVRLEIIEAHHLKKSDVGMLGMGKSDPYVNIIIGSQEFRTPTIYNTINPKWNFICEAPVFLSAQSVELEVMDEDQGSKDDFLGKASLSLETMLTENIIDAWISLKDTNTGKIHLKVTWISLEHSIHNLEHQIKECQLLKSKYKEQGRNEFPFGCVAFLLIYLDSANNLPISPKSIGEPSPQVIFNLRRQIQKSVVKNFTSNPVWQESFHYLIDEYSPYEELSIEVIDTKNGQVIGKVAVPMSYLTESKDMTFSEPLLVRQFSHNFDLHATFSLYFLNTPRMDRVKIVRDDTIERDRDNIPTMEDMIKGTLEPFAIFSGLKGNIIEQSQHNRQPFLNGQDELEETDEVMSHQKNVSSDNSTLMSQSLSDSQLETNDDKDHNKFGTLMNKARKNLNKAFKRKPSKRYKSEDNGLR